MNAPLHTEADIGRALLEHVVNPKGDRPKLEITTPKGMFHLVTIEGEVIAVFEDGKLTFIMFHGKPPIGRREVFVWPSMEVQEAERTIIGLQVYGI